MLVAVEFSRLSQCTVWVVLFFFPFLFGLEQHVYIIIKVQHIDIMYCSSSISDISKSWTSLPFL